MPRPPSMSTAAEVRTEARERSTDVLSQWSILHRIIERLEEVLRKRWLKKTKTQRTAILLGAWPKMAQKHRPDFEVIRVERPRVCTLTRLPLIEIS